ncbi:protoporphyrin IX magnesium-chelatase [Desulfallas thermosapovorans DSM 6562]|uniref:Mg-protoporphyrin IX chelatase n=2 Tax=Desulfallas thermosapovorans TaxID=58137 RepID=A0A5S4ZTG4_9FIRM|nr:protoporphyrin IX magnesium-chelatase [Desulfallas thermosapovorans DSM 6562]
MCAYHRMVYPFSAIVGQEKLKLGLILCAINEHLGGILIRGAKGTAKSTAVRALAALLPEVAVVKGCPFNCHPQKAERLCAHCRKRLANGEILAQTRRQVQVIELPVSSTEDRVLGGLDFGQTIKKGVPTFEPGLLARAHRGIIYIDEVNLLDHHIVDILLDAAAMGVNVVEREGISYTHDAQFILIGTMNPEEGDLRPQFKDRFGLCVQVEGELDPGQRVKIIRRREQFEADPREFYTRWAAREQELRERITAAKKLLPRVKITGKLLNLVSGLCLARGTPGHRADITLAATARTVAAWHGRDEVQEQDVLAAAELVLLHRARQSRQQSHMEGMDNHETTGQREMGEQQPGEKANPGDNNQQPGEPANPDHVDHSNCSRANRPVPTANNSLNNAPACNGTGKARGNFQNGSSPLLHQMVFNIIEPFLVKHLSAGHDRLARRDSGRRFWTKTTLRSGRYVRSTMQPGKNDLAFDATLRAAAPYQCRRQKDVDVAVIIEKSDIREKVREKHTGQLILFVVDASGSMGARQRMSETKGAILSLLVDAYQKRDKIGLVTFRDKTAEILLPPTNSVDMGQRLLKDLPVGGKTPLAAGLLKSYELASIHLRKHPEVAPLLVIITDGKSNVSLGGAKPLLEALQAGEIISVDKRIKSLVVDVEKNTRVTFGVTRELAWVMGADFYRLEELKAKTLVDAVRRAN